MQQQCTASFKVINKAFKIINDASFDDMIEFAQTNISQWVHGELSSKTPSDT